MHTYKQSHVHTFINVDIIGIVDSIKNKYINYLNTDPIIDTSHFLSFAHPFTLTSHSNHP